MSKGDRNAKPIPSIAIAVLLLTLFVLGTLAIWLSGEHGPKTVSNSYEASKYTENAQNRVNATCLGLEGASMAECVIKIEQSERENHNTQKDIRAQRYMAVWGFVMAYAAIGTLGVATVGLVWIKATLDETREAVRAADDAVTVTREIGEAQTRAYLAVKSIRWLCKPGEADFIRAECVIENFGQTPAFKCWVEFQVTAVISPVGKISFETAVSALQPVPKMPGGSNSVHVKGDEIPIRAECKTQLGILDLIKGRSAVIFLRGWATYEDIFGREHRLDFCEHFDAVCVEKGFAFLRTPGQNKMT